MKSQKIFLTRIKKQKGLTTIKKQKKKRNRKRKLSLYAKLSKFDFYVGNLCKKSKPTIISFL